MGKLTRRRWTPSMDLTGLSRRARRACDYEAYLPDYLVGRDFIFYSNETADIADAEREIAGLNTRARALANTEALARLLLRAESVASSRIEGLEVGAGRLLRAGVAELLGEEPSDVTAVEVLANIEAMALALEAVSKTRSITPQILKQTHACLLARTSASRHAGKLRTAQNWIGGSDYSPCTADFVPPPPEAVADLLTDLCEFCNADSLPAVAQAAIAHAQFETIHPFADGNGRVGRALIHMIFRRRSLAVAVTPPVSLVLATLSKDYIRGLSLTRYKGSPQSKQAADGMNEWIGIFAAACRRAVSDADQFEDRIARIQEKWRARLGSTRAKSATELLLQKLPGSPIVTVGTAASLIGRSIPAVNDAVARLQDARILTPIRVGHKRNRVFEARDVITAFTELERRLGSRVGNTKIAAPTRAVPYRPTR